MVRSMHSDQIAQKNAETHQPIDLWRVNISDTPEVSGEEDLYITSDDTNTDYFETNDGVHTARTYIAGYDIRFDQLEESTDGSIAKPTLTVENVSRAMEAFLQARDYLRGRKVTHRRVYRANLANQLAYAENIYAIDYHEATVQSVKFHLSSRSDVFMREYPKQLQMRTVCQHRYKGRGCWLDNGDGTFTAPAGFEADKTRFFTSKTISNTADPSLRQIGMVPVSLPMINKATDQFVIDLRKGDVLAVPTSDSGITIGSTGGDADYDYTTTAWHYSDLTGLGISTTWQTFTFDLADFADVGGGPDLGALDALKVFINWVGTASHQLQFRNAYFQINEPFGFAQDRDSCRRNPENCIMHNNLARIGAEPSIDTGIARIYVG